MKTIDYRLTDHLGADFDTQSLMERKRRIDAQIEEHTRVLFDYPLSENAVSLITNTLVGLLAIQKDYSCKIKFIQAICLN